MRLIGMAERAFDLMCRRALDRVAFGRPLAEQGVVQEWIADVPGPHRAARLLVLKTAWLIDTVGAKGAHTEISAIKIAAPHDRAVGHRQGDPGARRGRHVARTSRWPGCGRRPAALRFADGPDEVHRMVLARRELKRYQVADRAV